MRYAQQGISYWSIMVLMLLAFFMVKIGLFAVPAYLENKTINTVIRDRLLESEKMGPEALRAAITHQLGVNGLTVRPDDIMTVTGSRDEVEIVTNYERRGNLIGNIDLIAHFSRRFSYRNRDGEAIIDAPLPPYRAGETVRANP